VSVSVPTNGRKPSTSAARDDRCQMLPPFMRALGRAMRMTAATTVVGAEAALPQAGYWASERFVSGRGSARTRAGGGVSRWPPFRHLQPGATMFGDDPACPWQPTGFRLAAAHRPSALTRGGVDGTRYTVTTIEVGRRPPRDTGVRRHGNGLVTTHQPRLALAVVTADLRSSAAGPNGSGPGRLFRGRLHCPAGGFGGSRRRGVARARRGHAVVGVHNESRTSRWLLGPPRSAAANYEVPRRAWAGTKWRQPLPGQSHHQRRRARRGWDLSGRKSLVSSKALGVKRHRRPTRGCTVGGRPNPVSAIAAAAPNRAAGLSGLWIE